MSGIWLSLGLALRELRHHWLLTLTQVLALAAILTPLLLLDALRVGVIDGLIGRISEDPRNRQIVLTQQGRYPPSQLETWRRDPRVAFIAGHATPIARELSFAKAAGGLSKSAPGVVLASGPGDPLLPPAGRPPRLLEAVITQSLAQKLGLAEGEALQLETSRHSQGRDEWMTLTFRVSGIVPSSLWAGDGALLAEETLSGIERWRDGFAAPALGLSGAEPEPDPAHRNFRLYARDLPALKSLTDMLQSLGVPVVAPRLKDYENIVSLNQAMTTLFALIAGVSGVGFLISSAAAQWGDVTRKRRAFSILRLHGLSRLHVSIFPITQAATVALLGWAAAVGFLHLAALALAEPLAALHAAEGPLLKPSAASIAAALFATVTASWIASIAAAWRVTRIDPGEGLHDR